MKNTYASPKMAFVKAELFEQVAAQCWAEASLYCLVDPTDDDNCGSPYFNMQYADLKDYATPGGGCNATQINAIRQYLLNTYGEGTKNQRDGHYLTNTDIDTIFASGGGNSGQALQASQYIVKVRSY